MAWSLGVVAMLSGCANCPYEKVPPVPPRADMPERNRPAPETASRIEAYRIDIGDKLLVNSYYHPNLKQPVTVQTDGRVALLLVGTVEAAGKTREQLAKELTRAYDRYVENAEITVSVEDSPGQAVYVSGEVAKPTMLPMVGEMTLMQSISQAGGFLATAKKDQVLIVRKEPDGRFRTVQANAERILRNDDDEIYLRRQDIVYVPKSAIAKVDQFVDQYLNQVVPRWILTTFGLGYQLNSGGGGTTVISPVAR